MARTPVTRVQLDAYRFGQRRLESALARRDPVLLHEEIRGQHRVVLTGIASALVAVLVAVVLAKLWPAPDWTTRQIVIGAPSGQMYAVIHQADGPRLVPVRNLAAARLVRYAAERDASSATGTWTELDDAALAPARRTAPAAVPGADATLPGEGTAPKPPGPWALCDTAEGASVIAGAAPAPVMAPGDGLLLRGPERREYLVVAGHKHRIDADEVYAAYGLRDVEARATSDSVLDAIPDGEALAAPRISGAGRSSTALPERSVGDVVRVARPGQPDDFYLVLAGGVAQVAEPVGALVRAVLGADRSVPAPTLRAEQVDALDRVPAPLLDAYPKVAPRLLSGSEAGAVCWRWGANARGGELVVGAGLPLAPDRSVVRLAQADGVAGPKLDLVALPAGSALVACAVASVGDCAPSPGSGSSAGTPEGLSGLWLVGETGVGYPVVDADTATALGIRSWSPAPAAALRLLPSGPPLDVAQAQRTVDVLGPAS